MSAPLVPARDEIRARLDKYGLRAKKSWGQNFLIADGVYDLIVRATVRTPGQWVVEIGSGLGTLTSRLADAQSGDARVISVERDPDMAEVLRGELGTHPRIELVFGDALQIDYAALAARAGGQLAMAGNLPYQIASRLIFGVLEARAHLSHAVVMLQKEMADRLLAPPDADAYGALGVMVQTYADVRRVVLAPSRAFLPAPKVDSSVVQITPLPAGTLRAEIHDEKLYSVVVHAAFGQRRKTLRNALRSRFSDDVTLAVCEAVGIDAGRRGETLSIPEFARLTNEFSRAAPPPKGT